MAIQKDLFAELESAQSPSMPSGFRYQDDIISEAEETALVASLGTLELKPFEFHGHVGNRRVTSFGLRYDYARRTVELSKYLVGEIRHVSRLNGDDAFFSVNGRVSKKGKSWVFPGVFRFFRIKRVRMRLNGGGRGIRTPVALSG